MNIWFKNNIWWIGLIVTVLIGLFPKLFTSIGERIFLYFSMYWLQGLLLIIVALLVVIILMLKGKPDKHAP